MVARLILWGFACLLLTTITATLGGIVALLRPNSAPLPLESYFYPKNPSAPSFHNYHLSRPINILVMGIDPALQGRETGELETTDIFSGLSDTIILVRLDPTDFSVNLLWIPRDTQVKIPDHGQAKINQANAIGGAALASRVVSLNFYYVPIDRYVRISPTSLSKLVDLLGGLEIFIPEPMSYTDITGKFTINLAAGWQTINGNQAIQFARFRSDELGDIGRIQRQQALLRSLQQRLLSSPAQISNLPKIILELQKSIDTNLNGEELITLVNFLTQLQRTDLKMVLLPGQFSNPKNSDSSDWIVNSATRKQMIQPYLDQGSVSRLKNIRSPQQIKIAIQSATGDPKDSQKLLEYLTTLKFKTVYQIEPWPTVQQQTQIIAQTGNIESAQNLQKLLKFGKLETSSVGDINSDITIRLGLDLHRQFLIDREP